MRVSSPVYWYSQQEISYSPKLRGQKKTQVVIVGGGMLGLSAAQRLIKAGRKVILLERDFCGSGASGKSSGFITPDSEIDLSTLVGKHGVAETKKIWEFVLSGVEHIRTTIKTHDINCDFQNQDSCLVANTRAGFRHVRQEHEVRKKLGYSSVLHDEKTLSHVLKAQNYKGGVHYPGTFSINSFRYCQALKELLQKQGVEIFEQTTVTDIREGVVTTDGGEVHAEYIMVCADRFIPQFARMKKEIYHVQTFLALSKPLPEKVMANIFPKKSMMTWDTDLVYHYFRSTIDNRLLVGGGDLRFTYARKPLRDTKKITQKLHRYILKKFPFLHLDFEHVWSGMLGVSKDLLPVMGHDKQSKKIWFVGAATGLPWAAALGTYAAEKYLDGRKEFDQQFFWQRKFVIGRSLQTVLTTPVTYAVSHGIEEYL